MLGSTKSEQKIWRKVDSKVFLRFKITHVG